jgi:SAM-dependent methyltransferase
MDDDPEAYGAAWAAEYDGLFEDRDDPSRVSERLKELTPGRRLFEVGIGTGRLAIPLHDDGWTIAGIDVSEPMLERLRARAGDRPIEIHRGDIRTAALGARFDVVLIAFSTLFLLPDQAAQVDCIRRSIEHLAPGGYLVIETFVPDHTRWSNGRRVALSRWVEDGVELEAASHDRAEQTISVRYVSFGGGRVSVRPLRLRYAWPAEIDLMAALAGASLVRRSADWSGAPYESTSGGHVSVYALPG